MFVDLSRHMVDQIAIFDGTWRIWICVTFRSGLNSKTKQDPHTVRVLFCQEGFWQ
jgi:hypothetical protein